MQNGMIHEICFIFFHLRCYYFGYYYSTNFLKTGVQLLFNIVLVSAVQWSDLAISIHISPSSGALLHPWRSWPRPRAGLPVLYGSFPLALYFTYDSVYMFGEGNGNPWTEEPGRLQSMGSLRVRHDWVTSLSLFTFMHWRRKWQPTPVLLPGESQGRGSLVGCCLWGRTESDTTEAA